MILFFFFKSGYTSLHVACHFGQINMVRYLLQLGANVNIETNVCIEILFYYYF
jgi:ankyrin repeat protein